MKFFSLILLAGLSIAENESPKGGPSMRARNAEALAGYEGYAIEKPTFSGPINGREFSFNGTIQEYIAAAKIFDPTFDADSAIEVRDINTALEERTITARNCCPLPGQPWTGANRVDINEGANYLRGLNTRIYLNGRSCSRISCSYDAAIWMCNDNTWQVYPQSWFLADTAIGIKDNCLWHGTIFTCGQSFDSSGFNIIVRGDDC